ncbi:MAG TPA: AGE family epimerase/isomerase, partial [Cyclobacteriaceae bacterium]|nr:AGE family epimerase/isomerase [Cyclobacteriaceae bacterium]
MRICVVFLIITAFGCANKTQQHRNQLADEIEGSLKNESLAKWYPLAMDTVYGGFLSGFTFDFKPTGDQDKMIVTQARHTWTNSKAFIRYPEVKYYREGAALGFRFLRDFMWDKQYGGFYWLVDRGGNVKGDSSKTAYGNAFGIYGLAAYYEATHDTTGLNLAKKAFLWMEAHSHDPVSKGYFQHLGRNGAPIIRQPGTPSTSDLGYKDQNSSIHLLEALTELYEVWPDPLVRERLKEMLILIRDTITTENGNLTLFLQPDWTPVSFADSTKEVILRHRNLDHVSFGHDVETAYLLLEASHALGLRDDSVTLRKAKRMVDHALRNGWDDEAGGFYDEGYYFKGENRITIIRDTKNWWAQAEGMNTLLLMADLFPEDEMRYFSKFEKLWGYAKQNLIDHENGDWFAGGIDKQPELKTA